MKRIVLSAFLALGMTMPVATPAQAVFGLSTCEKVKKQISSEEKVGLELWRNFNDQRQTLLKSKNSTWQDVVDLIELTPEMVDSDMRIFRLADANSSCFTSKQIAKVRQGISKSKRNTKTINAIINSVVKNPSSGDRILTQEQINLVKQLSEKYEKPFS